MFPESPFGSTPKQSGKQPVAFPVALGQALFYPESWGPAVSASYYDWRVTRWSESDKQTQADPWRSASKETSGIDEHTEGKQTEEKELAERAVLVASDQVPIQSSTAAGGNEAIIKLSDTKDLQRRSKEAMNTELEDDVNSVWGAKLRLNIHYDMMA